MTENSKPQKVGLPDSKFSSNGTLRWCIQITTAMVLLYFPLTSFLENIIIKDADRIFNQIIIDHNRLAGGDTPTGLRAVSLIYSPIDIISFFDKDHFYRLSEIDALNKSSENYFKFKGIVDRKKYVADKGVEAFEKEFVEWQNKADPSFLKNSMMVWGLNNIMVLFVGFYFSIVGLSVVYIISVYENKNPRKYIACPYSDCDKSVLVYGRWVCHYCNNKQLKEMYVTDSCSFCGRQNKTETCESCSREFYL